MQDAKAVCDKLDIPLHAVNFSREYWDQVFEYFLQEYREGRTPNPDILCNKEIKFKAFLDYALSLGADAIATGHYAQTNGQQLLRGKDSNKDQSYFLHAINQQALSQTMFPIGHLTKPEVRQLAKEAGFINHAKKDSVGICFIGEKDFKAFLSRYLPATPGEIETDDGRMIGRHDGLMYYTLGQRQGLGIGGRKDATDEPWYVVAKDLKRNVLIVGQGHEHPLLFSSVLIAKQIHWVNSCEPSLPFNCTAKTRYRQTDQACTISKLAKNTYEIRFKQPQWAVTPGQYVVFYQNDICLGGGVIQSSC